MIKQLLRILFKGLSFFGTYFPHICIYIALSNLANRTLRIITHKDLSTSTLVIFFSSIGLCLSLATVSFAYARASEGDLKKRIINAGEHFFVATILFVTALLLAWIPLWVQELLSAYDFIDAVKRLYSIILGATVGLSFFNSICAAMAVSKGIFILQNILDSRTFPYWSFDPLRKSKEKLDANAESEMVNRKIENGH